MYPSPLYHNRGSFLLSTFLLTTLIIPISAISYVSLGSYSHDAKNATVRENIGQLSSVINMTVAAGPFGFSSLIDTTVTDKTVQVNTEKTIFGKFNTSDFNLATKAGDVNWDNLPASLDRSRMQDQYGNLPLLGYAVDASKSASQIATTLEDQVYVLGNFVSDGSDLAAQGLIRDIAGDKELVNGQFGRHR